MSVILLDRSPVCFGILADDTPPVGLAAFLQRVSQEVAQLGACPRIGILFKIEEFSKNKHSHIGDIASIIFNNSKEFGRKGILGQPPRNAILPFAFIFNT